MKPPYRADRWRVAARLSIDINSGWPTASCALLVWLPHAAKDIGFAQVIDVIP
jgi:hypothetical protein